MKRKVDNMKIKCKIVTLAALLMCSTTMLAEEKAVSDRWKGAVHIYVYALMHGGVSDGEAKDNDLGFHVTYDSPTGLDNKIVKFVSAKMDQHGNKSNDSSPITDTAKHGHAKTTIGGQPSFHFRSSKYWFYIECIENTKNGSMEYTNSDISNDKSSIYMFSDTRKDGDAPKYKLYRVPTEILLDSNADDYCEIKVESGTINLGYNSRNVKVYVDDDYKGQQDETAIFSERTFAAGDLEVTPKTGYYIDTAKGNGTGITLSGSKNGGTYNVYLVTKYTVTFNGNGNTSGSMSNQSFTYGTAQALRSNAFKKEYTVTFNGNSGTCGTASLKSAFQFKEWKCSNGSTYADKQSVSNLTTTNGGSVTMTAQWYNQQAVTLPSASRTGYTFNGWYTSASGGTKAGGSGSSYTPSGNVTLYAQWTLDTYTVSGSIDNGGSVTNSSQSIDYGKASAAMVFTPRTGYKITAVSINGTAQSLSFPLNTYTYPAQSSVTQNITVSVTTSRYYPVTGSIDNGGTVSNSSQSIRSGSQNAAMVFTPATGYEIKSVKVNGTEQLSGNPVSTYTYPAQTISGTKTVVATTALKKYTVSGSMDHGRVTGTPQTVKHGSASAAMEFMPDPGYKISGVSIDGVPQSLSFPLSNWYYPAITSVTHDITVSVTATATNYTVTYNANGGSVTPASQTYNIESTSTLATSATRTGYTFNGWKATSASAGSWTQNTVYSGGKSLTGSWGNVTLQAQWTKGGYRATFDANGGTVSPDYCDFTIEDAITLPVPTWTGHEFKGWKVTTAEGSWVKDSQYTGTTIAKGNWGNVTLQAQWSVIPFGSLKVVVEGLEDGDGAVCTAVSAVDGSEYTVAVTSNDNTATLKNIYVGGCTVTSTGWQWNYDISESNPQTATVKSGETVTVTFTLSPKSGTSKHDESNIVNVISKENN